MTHYNIQINVQRVSSEQPSSTVLRRGQAETPPRRSTIELLGLKVVASSEREAYRKAAQMLEAASPKRASMLVNADAVPDEEEDDDEEEL